MMTNLMCFVVNKVEKKMDNLEIIVVRKVLTKMNLLEVFEVNMVMSLSLLELIEVSELKMCVMDLMELSWKNSMMNHQLAFYIALDELHSLS